MTAHKVDNQGGYDNYILFEFNQTVVIDQVRLDLVANDSDMTAWIGNANNPYNNHLSLSDALLASFASEDNNASNSSDRWANINAAGRAGNVLVVAASTSDTTPDDAFKVHYLSVGCPQTPATVTIIKQVQLPGGGTASTESFPFAATNFIPSSFSLVDNNVTGPDRVSAQVYNFGSGNAITIKENQMFSWSLLAIECTGTGTYTASGNITTGIATITVQPGATVTCTYRNSRLTTTAAPVNITGRVLDANGAPIGGATLFLADPGTGVQQTARTNPFGYYKFEGIDNENFYVLRVSDRRHTFVPDTMYFSLIDNLDGADFVAMP